MSRSGTGSMRQALETLGIGKTFHGLRLGERPDLIPIWMDIIDRKYPPSDIPKDKRPITAAHFDRLIGDCAAVTDMPCAAFWRELLAAYPDAKVVLVERDVDAWFESFNKVAIQAQFSLKGRILANRWVAWWVGFRNAEMLQRLSFCYFQATGKEELEKKAKRVYKEHNGAVREACRVEGREFLDYEIGSGWEPLCEFLGVEVPQGKEFPRSNRADEILPYIDKAQRAKLMIGVKSLLKVVSFGTAVFAVAWITWWQPGAAQEWMRRVLPER